MQRKELIHSHVWEGQIYQLKRVRDKTKKVLLVKERKNKQDIAMFDSDKNVNKLSILMGFCDNLMNYDHQAITTATSTKEY